MATQASDYLVRVWAPYHRILFCRNMSRPVCFQTIQGLQSFQIAYILNWITDIRFTRYAQRTSSSGIYEYQFSRSMLSLETAEHYSKFNFLAIYSL
jgi:hypothetical protein